MIFQQVFNPYKFTLDNRDVARIVLMNKLGDMLANPENHPPFLYAKAYHYMMKGDIGKEHYDTLVNYLIKDEQIRKDLM